MNAIEQAHISLMNIIGLDEKTYPGALFEAVRIIKAGGVIVFPTDTIYGIGGNALDLEVTKRIYNIKRCPSDKSMIVLVKDLAMARKYAYIDIGTEKILESLWPGPVSVVLQKKDSMPDIVSGGEGTIALRVPDSVFLSELLKQVEVPIIATSANVSGEPAEPLALDALCKSIEGSLDVPDVILDAGILPQTGPSTLLDLTDRRHPVILRYGAFPKDELESILGTNL